MKYIFELAAKLFLVGFINQSTFGQVSTKATAKDWLSLDPKADSIAGISLSKAYKLLTGRHSKTVIVAVIDNGFDLNHEDMKNVFWTNKQEIPDNGIDDDHNGYVDDIHGWNFRGARDGTIIENELAGATQIYLTWKNRFENKDTNSLPAIDKRDLIIFNKAKAEYFDKIQNAKDSIEINYSYNINYHSSSLIQNDSETSTNHFYGSPYIKLPPGVNHGTYVSGIIAAERNNSIGTNGIAD